MVWPYNQIKLLARELNALSSWPKRGIMDCFDGRRRKGERGDTTNENLMDLLQISMVIMFFLSITIHFLTAMNMSSIILCLYTGNTRNRGLNTNKPESSLKSTLQGINMHYPSKLSSAWRRLELFVILAEPFVLRRNWSNNYYISILEIYKMQFVKHIYCKAWVHNKHGMS